jgi:predicted aspartyl protease
MTVYDYSSVYVPAAPLCSITLGAGGREPSLGPLEALLDTGADICVVPIDYLRQVGAQQIGEGRARTLWGDARSVGVYAVSMQLEGLRLNALRVLADDRNEEIVLGRLVLNRLKIVLDGPAALLEILS